MVDEAPPAAADRRVPAAEPTHERLAAWLEAHPSNRDGADKTWVLHLMRRLESLTRGARILPVEGPMDPYVEACVRLGAAGVRYLVIGAFGINLYASEVGVVITTADCDLLLPPSMDELEVAVRTLRSLGYALEAGGDPLPDEDRLVLEGILRTRACVRARRADARIDLPLEMSGATFDELWERQRRILIEGQAVRVGPLRALIRSKELADRPKDRAFLAAHRSALEEMVRRDEREDA